VIEIAKGPFGCLREAPGVKIEAPNLMQMSNSELEAFWLTHQPTEVRNLGDRLLAESLPRFPPREERFYPDDLTEVRQAIPLTIAQMAQALGVTESTVMAWESFMVRPPASLGLIYRAFQPTMANS
jgi:DNA-binding transcriptional regulator YiaG